MQEILNIRLKSSWVAVCVIIFLVSTSLIIPAQATQKEDDRGEMVELIQSSQEKITEVLNGTLGKVNEKLFTALMFDVAFGAFKEEVLNPATGKPLLDEKGNVVQQGPELKFLVMFLAAAALFFTFYHRFSTLNTFGHAIEIVRGKYDKKGDEGDISSFRALTSALSATVGLGNISGVAVAMVIGGPGALFWMMVLGFFGMASKFHESTLAQMYRIINPDGSISGGPMYTLSRGFSELGLHWEKIGKIAAVVFAICCMGAAIGGGNMYQANQAFAGFFSTFIEPHVEGNLDAIRLQTSFGFGILMAVIVGMVVIGGITRIGAATARIVPFMAALYVSACGIIIISNYSEVPGLIGLVLSEAFQGQAAVGGMLGAMVMGFQRALFSSEAGLGSSAIAHSAAKTPEPVREGMVASLEPFVDTIVVCFMTGMAVLITGAYRVEGIEGVQVTLYAFEQAPFLSSLFPAILSICIVLFAFSTMLSWCYYGERAWGYLFNIKSVIVFRLVFVLFVFIGTVITLGAVMDFADVMLFSMALPNIFGGIILAGKVKNALAEYLRKYKSGDFEKEAVDFEV